MPFENLISSDSVGSSNAHGKNIQNITKTKQKPQTKKQKNKQANWKHRRTENTRCHAYIQISQHIKRTTESILHVPATSCKLDVFPCISVSRYTFLRRGLSVYPSPAMCRRLACLHRGRRASRSETKYTIYVFM